MMTTKGEAVTVGIAQMTTAVMATVDHGVVVKTANYHIYLQVRFK
jgi:H/ACA ribonucleoprotein complex subunit 4